MARILFLGGTRFVGRAIALRAAAHGHEVAVFHRGQTGAELPFTHIAGERRSLRERADALRAWGPDVVVDCMAFTEDEANDTIAVFDGLDLRLLVLGSMDVYEVFRQVLKGCEFGDFPVAEDDPLSAERYYHGHDRIENYDKNLVTDAFLAAGRAGQCRPTVFRLPMVFGPGDRQVAGRHGEAIHHVVDRRPRYVIGAVAQAEIWTFGFHDNVAAAVLHALDRPTTVGMAYNVGERRQRSRRRWAALYAEAAGHDLRFGPVPDAWLDPDDDLEAPARHLIMDSGAYARDTGFVEPVGLEQQIEATLRWATDNQEALGEPPDYGAREALWARLCVEGGHDGTMSL